MYQRLQNLRERMAAENVPAALLMSPLNVGYVSGFSGSTAALLVTPEHNVFITDFRYAAQAAKEALGWEITLIQSSAGYHAKIAEQVAALGITELALEAEFITVATLEALGAKLEGVTLKPVMDLASSLRRVKDATEVGHIRAACGIADAAFEYILTRLRPGAEEREIAAELEFWMKKNGSEGAAFTTIVASGWRAALPHGIASDKPLDEGDFITFDFGAKVHGYCSDLTRTVVLGKATDRHREIYGVVLDANEAAIHAVRAGVEGRKVDSTARDLISQRGYGPNFGHGLGHGLGLAVHDHPGFGQSIDITLEAGMVLTIEPGVYIDNWGGVRIEDDVLVQVDGCEMLTHAPKELIEVPV